MSTNSSSNISPNSEVISFKIPPFPTYCGGKGGFPYLVVVEIIIFTLLRIPGKISEAYNNSFWDKK
jgi:hypothetical protein